MKYLCMVGCITVEDMSPVEIVPWYVFVIVAEGFQWSGTDIFLGESWIGYVRNG